MSDQATRPQPQFSPAEGQLLIAGFMMVSALFIALVLVLSRLGDQIIALPTLSIAGIVLLLISLAAIAYVFVRTGLQDPKQALGLPAGSIQAVIALSLIVLFAILSVFIFTSMGPLSQRKLTGLDKADRDAQVTALSSTFAGYEKASDGTYTVYVRDPGMDARNDVGKQLIVLIGTLMTSAVSFYFGTRATEAGIEKSKKGTLQGAGEASGDPPPDNFKVVPETISPGAEPQSVKVMGERVGKVASITFRQSGTLDGATFDGTISAKSERELICTVQPGDSLPTADYDMILTMDTGARVKAKGLKLLPASPD